MEIPEQDGGKPDTGELAISIGGRDITLGHMGAMREINDTVLRRLGNNYEVYRELRRDDQVAATFQQRRLALTSRQLIIEPGAEDAQSIRAADQLRENLAQIAFDRTNDKMMWGLLYGHGVAECMYEMRGGLVWLQRPKVRTPWRFRYDNQGRLRLLTFGNMVEGELMPERKFWTINWGADNDDDPYGLGLAHQLYWPVFFKKQGLGFWLRALEKFGAPSTVAKYPAGSDRSLINQALEVARRLRLDGAAAIPDTMTVDLLEAARGTVDQATFHRQMQAAIAKIILGQTMTTDDGSSLSQSQTHMAVREELTDADAELLCESFQNGPATWLTTWNFPGAATPIVRRPSAEDEGVAADLMAKKGLAVKALREAGLEPEPGTLEAIVGPGWRIAAQPFGATAIAAPAPQLALPPPSFAEAAGVDAPDAIDAFTDSMDWEPAMLAVRDRVAAFVESQPSLKAAAERIEELLGDPAFADAGELLARAMFETRVAGLNGNLLTDAQEAAQAGAG